MPERFLLRHEAPAHVERDEDLLLHILFVREPRDRLHDEPQRVVVGVGVTELVPNRARQPHVGELADGPFQRTRVPIGQQLRLVQLGQPARHREQVAHRHLR